MKLLLQKTERRYRFICLLIILVMGVFFIASSHRGKLSDFGNYYYGSKFLKEGKFNADVYDAWKFNRMIEREGEKGLFENYTPVPPFTAFLFVPFTVMDAHTAKTIFNTIGLLLFLIVLNASLAGRGDSKYFLLLPLILFLPMKSNMESGQLYLLLFSLLVGAFLLGEKKKYLLAGLCFALAIHLKIFPAIFLLFLLFTAQYKTLIYTIGCCLILFGTLFAMIRVGVIHDYFIGILPRLMNNEINDPFATSYQSVSVFLRQLFVQDQLLNPHALLKAPILYPILNGLFLSFLLFLGICVTVSEKYSRFLKFGTWTCIMMLVSGYGSGYMFILFLIPCLTFLHESSIENRYTTYLFLLAILITVIPLNYFTDLILILRFPRLWLMLTFLVIVILQLEPEWNWKYMLLAMLYPLISFVLHPRNNDDSRYLLDKEQAMLTGYYVGNENQLILSCFDRRGFEMKSQPLKEAILRENGLSCDGHQIKYGEHVIYASSSRISMPAWMGDDKLMFLSDKDRGVGMYALRYIYFDRSKGSK